MDKRLSGFISLGVVFLLTSCGMPPREKPPFADSHPKAHKTASIKYNIVLIGVERFTKGGIPSETPILKAVSEDDVLKYSLEDASVRILWLTGPVDMAFTFYNKGDSPVAIIWEEARLIDEKGNTHKLVHTGIGYEERNLFKVPTIVPARGILDDFVHPADYFHHESIGAGRSDDRLDYWDRVPFLPVRVPKATEQPPGGKDRPPVKEDAEILRETAGRFMGKTFQIMLPVEVRNTRIAYLCTFRIDKAEVVEEVKKRSERPPDGKPGDGEGERERGRPQGRPL